MALLILFQESLTRHSLRRKQETRDHFCQQAAFLNHFRLPLLTVERLHSFAFLTLHLPNQQRLPIIKD